MHQLPADKLKQRDVIFIDIANDPVAPNDYKEDEDPTKFKSAKTGRGPLLGSDWKENVKPVMTCYKLVTVEFKWFGLQTRVENFIQKSERRLFTNFHRWVRKKTAPVLCLMREPKRYATNIRFTVRCGYFCR